MFPVYERQEKCVAKEEFKIFDSPAGSTVVQAPSQSVLFDRASD